MSGEQKRKPTGKVNYIWVLAAGYLLYIAYKLFSGLWNGEAERLWVNVLGGSVFAVAAVLMLLREWRAYQYGLAHKDDPETWSDEPEEDGTPETDAPAPEEAPEPDGIEEEGERP